MKKEKRSLEAYLTLAESRRIDPNFYLSIPYLTLSNAQCWERNGWTWVEADKWCLFPPLYKDPIVNGDYPKDTNRVWCDFYESWQDQIVAEDLLPGIRKEFLDWEYLFDPTMFNAMNGGCWETFRKNCRKWPNRNIDWTYCDRVDHPALVTLLTDWLTAKQSTIQDGEFLARYVINSAGVVGIHRRYLYNRMDELIAVNIWDTNWQYINYRICIVKSEEPFLAEFVRWLFYTDGEIQRSGKLVNDGGVVDNPGLEAFKDKMNPVRKRQVYSWIR